MADFLVNSMQEKVKALTPKRWNEELQNILASTSKQIACSSAIREEAAILRCERDAAARRALDETRFALELRKQETQKLITDLSASKEAVDVEMNAVVECRASLQSALESLVVPIRINADCIIIRERRRTGDRVQDEVQEKLAQEHGQLLKSKRRLEALVLDSLAQENELRNWQTKVYLNVCDKENTLKIELRTLSIQPSSADSTFKPDPTTEMPNSQNEDAWREFTMQMISDSYLCITKSRQLRDASIKEQNQLLVSCAAAGDEVDFSFRQQVHTHSQALRLLVWQKNEAELELNSLDNERKRMESCLEAKDHPCSVVESRLNERKEKRETELVNDCGQSALKLEWESIKASMQLLEQKLAKIANRMNAVDDHIHALNTEIQIKTHARRGDEQCQRIRRRDVAGKDSEQVESSSAPHLLDPHACSKPSKI